MALYCLILPRPFGWEALARWPCRANICLPAPRSLRTAERAECHQGDLVASGGQSAVNRAWPLVPRGRLTRSESPQNKAVAPAAAFYFHAMPVSAENWARRFCRRRFRCRAFRPARLKRSPAHASNAACTSELCAARTWADWRTAASAASMRLAVAWDRAIAARRYRSCGDRSASRMRAAPWTADVVTAISCEPISISAAPDIASYVGRAT